MAMVKTDTALGFRELINAVPQSLLTRLGQNGLSDMVVVEYWYNLEDARRSHEERSRVAYNSYADAYDGKSRSEDHTVDQLAAYEAIEIGVNMVGRIVKPNAEKAEQAKTVRYLSDFAEGLKLYALEESRPTFFGYAVGILNSLEVLSAGGRGGKAPRYIELDDVETNIVAVRDFMRSDRLAALSRFAVQKDSRLQKDWQETLVPSMQALKELKAAKEAPSVEVALAAYETVMTNFYDTEVAAKLATAPRVTLGPLQIERSDKGVTLTADAPKSVLSTMKARIKSADTEQRRRLEALEMSRGIAPLTQPQTQMQMVPSLGMVPKVTQD